MKTKDWRLAEKLAEISAMVRMFPNPEGIADAILMELDLRRVRVPMEHMTPEGRATYLRVCHRTMLKHPGAFFAGGEIPADAQDVFSVCREAPALRLVGGVE